MNNMESICENGLNGLTFVIDGKLRNWFPDILSYYLDIHGAKLKQSVTKQCNYLVSTNPSSETVKAKRARELQIPVLAEDEFYFLIRKLYHDGETVLVPSWVKCIPQGAFSLCKTMKTVILPENLLEIGSAFIDCTNLVTITIPARVHLIDAAAFQGCSSLKTIVLPLIKSIRFNTFRDCKSLSSVTIPDCVTFIDNSAFQGCASLETIRLPEKLEFLGKEAFRDCSELKTISIPNGVHVIRHHTFLGCNKLQHVYLSPELHTIEYKAFQGCKKLTIHAPANSYAEQFAKKNGIPVSLVSE